jgi:PRTRC genetic system protein F
MAALALAASAHGVPLPTGRFMNPKDTLNKQWKSYIASECGKADPLAMYLHIEVAEDKVLAAFSSRHQLTTFRLKPVILDLNKVKPGLGWFVYDIVASAGRSLPIYDPAEVAGFAEHIWFQGNWTDEGFLDELKCMEDTFEGKSLEEVREICEHPFPSDMIASVDGHKWMLNAYCLGKSGGWTKMGGKPKACALSDAEAFAHGRSRSPLKTLVCNALDLRRELTRKGGIKWEDLRPKASDLGHGYLDDDAYLGRIGATCFVVWDKPHMAWDAASHFEEYEMNGGEETDIFYLVKADPTVAGELDRFVSNMQAIIKRYALVSKVLQHFPTR